MNRLQHPAVRGGLVVGIVFNCTLSLLGVLGFSLLEAVFMTLLVLTMGLSVGMQVWLRRWVDDA